MGPRGGEKDALEGPLKSRSASTVGAVQLKPHPVPFLLVFSDNSGTFVNY